MSRKKRETTPIATFEQANSEYDRLLKVMLLGDSGVGKSCLMLRYADDTYTESYISTIGIDFKIKAVDIESQRVKLQIWDTAAQGKFRTITSQNSRGAHAVVLAFDLTDRDSFTNLQGWLNDLDRMVASEKFSITLVGTKSDLTTKRVVEEQEVREFITEVNSKGRYHIDPDDYIETSAKTGRNVEKAFNSMAISAIKKLDPTVSKKINGEQKLRAELIAGLKSYTSTVDMHSGPRNNFSYGFLFFKNSRALNREANYYLALSLLKKLETTHESIASIFTHVERQRAIIINEHGLNSMPDYVNRGINSDKLNAVLNKARAGVVGVDHASDSERRPLLRK